MPGPFTVTAATNSVQLDSNRQSEAAFTVFNASGRPLRGQVRLKAEDPAATGWLSLEGEAEQDFDIAAAKQFTVKIQAPPDAQPGNYTFRLDVVGVENPDELYTEGPTVTFQVGEEREETEPFPWWIVAVVAGVVVTAGIILAIVLSNGDNTVRVPNVRGDSGPVAAETIENVGLEVASFPELEPSDDIAAGNVIRAEPEIGEEVERGTEVLLVISTGPEPESELPFNPNLILTPQIDPGLLLTPVPLPNP
jgi:serine/threonine-protein kinase